jgi:hypothetical protein
MNKKSPEEKTMKIKSAIAAVGLMIVGLSHNYAMASDDLPVLGGAKVKTLTETAMSKIRGGVFIGAEISGQYLNWYDNQVAYPLKFDLANPNVQSVFAAVQSGAIPATPGVLFNFLVQADPQGLVRGSPLGRMTSMGPCIPGFTVGC